MKLPSKTRYVIYLDPPFDPFEDWLWYTVFDIYSEFPDADAF